MVGALLLSFLYPSVSRAAAESSAAAAVVLSAWALRLTAHNALHSAFVSKHRNWDEI